MKILLAEDGPIDALILRRILQRAGYTVLTAPDGAKAMETLKAEGDVALVVADVDMPEMDGIQFLRTMRSTDEWRDTPFVFVSAHADPETVHRAVDLKPAAYLLKPITQPSRVLEVIARALEDRLKAQLRE